MPGNLRDRIGGRIAVDLCIAESGTLARRCLIRSAKGIEKCFCEFITTIHGILLAAEVRLVGLCSLSQKTDVGITYACCVRCLSKSLNSFWPAVTFALKSRSSLWFVFGFCKSEVNAESRLGKQSVGTLVHAAVDGTYWLSSPSASDVLLWLSADRSSARALRRAITRVIATRGFVQLCRYAAGGCGVGMAKG